MNPWQDFLESIANRYKIPPSPRKLFFFQFSQECRTWSIKTIEDEFNRIYQVNSDNFDDYRKRLYAILEEYCLELGEAKRGKSDILWRHLEQKYPEWAQANIPLTIDELWQELWIKAEERLDILGPINQNKLEVLSMGDEVERMNTNSEFSRVLQVGESIKIKVNPIAIGEIVVLERDQRGHVYCLCPSYLQKKNSLNSHPLIISDKFITLHTPDIVQLWMLVTPDPLTFNWFPMSQEQSLKIGCKELKDVLEILTKILTINGKAWCNTYRVIR
jgi:hypothetical protein